MSCPSTFSETRLRSSFFLTTPAKKPRTECCCQSVAFMIAAIVVPFGSYSIFSTADCFDDEDAGDFDDAVFEAAALVAAVGFDRVGTLLLAGRFTVRDDLRAVFANFDFDLLVAIWLSLGSMTASCAGTATSPRKLSSRAGGISRISKTNILGDTTRSFPWGGRANCEQSYGFLRFGREILRPCGNGLGIPAYVPKHGRPDRGFADAGRHG